MWIIAAWSRINKWWNCRVVFVGVSCLLAFPWQREDFVRIMRDYQLNLQTTQSFFTWHRKQCHVLRSLSHLHKRFSLTEVSDVAVASNFSAQKVTGGKWMCLNSNYELYELALTRWLAVPEHNQVLFKCLRLKKEGNFCATVVKHALVGSWKASGN